MGNPINHYHLTAKERDKLSFPAKWLKERKLLTGKILDFGCGFGSDVEFLKKEGFEIQGYDRYYKPDYPRERFDTILCIYVLNVLEQTSQWEVLMKISELLNPKGTAYLVVRRDITYQGYRTHKVHQKTTYQCNIELPLKSLFCNEFCEIYEFKRFTEIPKKTACIFCQPSANLQPITETAGVYAVYDEFPVSEGHALILPKVHFSSYFEMQEILQQELWVVANRVKRILVKKHQPDGFNVGINIGESAGQTIFHAHIHIIPRYKDDVEKPKGGVRNVIPGKGSY